jgi:hypothetical protein
VIGARPLPDFSPSTVDVEPKRLKLAVIANEVVGSREAITAADARHVSKDLVHTLAEF